MTSRNVVSDDLGESIVVEEGSGAVVPHVYVSNPASGGLTDAQLRATPVAASDRFTSGEVLADQSGADTVLTFAFSSAVQLVEVHCVGGEGRAEPYGGTPSATQGIRCGDDIPRMMPVPSVTAVKVYAATGTTVTVHGQRY